MAYFILVVKSNFFTKKEWSEQTLLRFYLNKDLKNVRELRLERILNKTATSTAKEAAYSIQGRLACGLRATRSPGWLECGPTQKSYICLKYYETFL